jgi:glutathionylspermidine synthase
MITISFYSASFNYSANLSKEHQMNMAETLNNSAQNFDNLQKEIDMLYTLTWSNNAIHDFLYSSEVDGKEEEQAVQYIKDLSHLNAHVDSIVLYNHQTDRYLSSR